MNLSPLLVINTERLLLRRINLGDKEEIFKLRSDDENLKYVNLTKHHTLDDSIKFIERINQGIDEDKFIMWAVELKKSSKLIGTVCLWNFDFDKQIGEIGYELNRSFQNQGYMNEAVKEVINYFFNHLKMKRLIAYTHQDNLKSIKLLKKNGFSYKEKAKENMVIYELIS